jgi:hypothetical protein
MSDVGMFSASVQELQGSFGSMAKIIIIYGRLTVIKNYK